MGSNGLPSGWEKVVGGQQRRSGGWMAAVRDRPRECSATALLSRVVDADSGQGRSGWQGNGVARLEGVDQRLGGGGDK